MTGIMVDAFASETQPFPTVSEVLSRRSDGLRTEIERAIRSFALKQIDLDFMANWHVVATNPYSYQRNIEPAREAIDETNWDALAITPPGVVWRYETASMVGGDDARNARAALLDGRVLIVAPDHPDLDRLESCERALADYPLLDDLAYAERERDAWPDLASVKFEDEIRDAVRSGTLTDDEAEMLDDYKHELVSDLDDKLHYANGFTGEYEPKFLDLLQQASEYVHASGQVGRPDQHLSSRDAVTSRLNRMERPSPGHPPAVDI